MRRYLMRRMQEEDVDQVTHIDREAFPNDWPPTSYRRELANRLAHYIVVCEGIDEDGKRTNLPEADSPRRAEGNPESSWARFASRVRHLFVPEKPLPLDNRQESVMGFAGLWVMLDEAHLSVIAVKESHRCRGLGELLLAACIEKAIELNAKMVTLEVRASNPIAQAFYEKFGFKKVGLRRAYYTDNREDAVLMTTDDITSAPFNARLRLLRRGTMEKLARWQAQAVVGPEP